MTKSGQLRMAICSRPQFAAFESGRSLSGPLSGRFRPEIWRGLHAFPRRDRERVGTQCLRQVTIVPIRRIASHIHIPIHRFLKTLVPGGPLPPAQSQQLIVRDEVSLVVKGTVPHVLNRFVGIQAKPDAYLLGNLLHGDSMTVNSVNYTVRNVSLLDNGAFCEIFLQKV